MFTKSDTLLKQTGFFCLLSGLCLSASVTFAAQDSSDPQDDLYNMSIEELMDMTIVSGSRRDQTAHELSVPVTVITAEDIHYSGLTSIPEILQFAVGVDVVRINRNFYAVGVRGLHDFTSDRTLTLINGRIADSAFFGGSEFWRLPVLVEDIDRIEIVRGPGGAAWGANAFTGVINIITKKPEDVLGGFASTTINEYGDSYTHLRWAQQQGKWTWKVSAGYEDKESSEDAGAGRFEINEPALAPLIGYPGSYTAQDYSRDWRFDFDAVYTYSDQTTVSGGAGYAYDYQGNFEFGGFYPPGESYFKTFRPYFRIDHVFDDDSTGYIQWFSNLSRSRIPSLVEWNTFENDIEAQLNFSPAENHTMSIGGNIRFIRVATVRHSEFDLELKNEPYDEILAGLFLIHRWAMTDRLTLEGQMRIDDYSETQTDWSTRLTALYAMDEAKDHMLRFSFARAFRAPLASLRNAKTRRIPIPPFLGGGYAFRVRQPDALDNEETWSIEGGYTGMLSKDTRIILNTYYQRFEKLIGYDDYTAQNIGGMDSYGVEVELEKKMASGKLSAWYAYNGTHLDPVGKDAETSRSYAPADHKVGITGRLFLPQDWSLNANYRYTNTTETYAQVELLPPADSSHRLDLSLSKQLAGSRGEFMVGVTDVFNQTVGPNGGLGFFTIHETPGRTFFARLQMNF